MESLSSRQAVEIARAICAKVEADMVPLVERTVAAQLEAKSSLLEASYAEQLSSTTKSLESEVERRLETKSLGLQKSSQSVYDRQMAEKSAFLQEAYKTNMLSAAKMLEEKVTKEMETKTAAMIQSFQATLTKMAEDLRRSEKSFEQRLASLSKMHEAGFEQIKSIVQGLPVPQVHLSVPESAINVNVKQEPVEVNIQDKAFNISVENKLEVPKRTTTSEKSIVYGPTGRPETIVEKTSEE
jgi:hypothetical protein